MAQEEISGQRCRAYSAWHRRLSTQRFVGIEMAQLLSLIDLDASLYVEYDDRTKEPLMPAETARDAGWLIKPATVTRNLARRCQPILPAYTVLYQLADYPNPADATWPDIAGFRVKRIWPEPQTPFKAISPQQWAEALLALRQYSARYVDYMLWNERMEGSNAAIDLRDQRGH